MPFYEQILSLESLNKGSHTAKTSDLFRVGPKQRSLQLLKFEHFYWLCKPASYLKGGCPCIGRELDPDLPRGRREFYHWTTNALQLLLVQVHESLMGLQALKRSLFGTNPKESMSRVWIPSCARKLCLSIWLNKYEGVTLGLQRLQIQKMTSCMSFHCLLVDSQIHSAFDIPV